VTVNTRETNTDYAAADGAVQFLEALFGGVVSPERRLSIFTTPDKRARFFSDVAEAVAHAVSRMKTQNVYFGLGLIAGEPKGRGKAADVCTIGGLWADIDLAAPWRADKPLPKTVDEAMTIVKAMPLAPSMVVDSGHGLHVYWLFKEPWVFESEEERLKAASLARGWHRLVCEAAVKFGWSLENLGDLSRVLRLPGTLNHKGETPVTVRIVESDPDRRYNPEDFETYAQSEGPAPAQVVDAALSPGTPLPAEKLAEACKSSPKFLSTWNRTRDDLKDQSQSAYDLALASIAARMGWNDQEITDLILAHRTKHGENPGKALRKDYVRRTLLKAREGISEEGIDSSCSDVQPVDEGETESLAVPLGTIDPETKKLVLSPRRTLPTAEAFVREFHTHPDGRTLLSWAGLLLSWQGNRYADVEDESLKNRLLPWLHKALRYIMNRRTGDLELVPFESNPGTVSSALESIRAYVHLPASVTPPAWLDGDALRPPADELLPCRSMVLHLPMMTRIEPTPQLFVINALDFDYDPEAPEPFRWLEFLDQVLPCDPESVRLLQTWFGYVLTGNTRLQKMLMLVGARRSGKGTLARVLARLVGAANVCGPTTSSLASQFGLQPLIGKSLAIVSDARFSGEHMPIVVERLLCISGEDALTVDRKFLGSVTLKLPTRFMFLTNELPKLTESSGALAGRFLILRFTQSFYGREDSLLTDKLLQERPGILKWAIKGWHRLRADGRFIEPASSRAAVEELEDLLSPVGAFVRERCIVGPQYRCHLGNLYAAWSQWCASNGRDHPGTVQSFGRDLAAAVPGARTRRNNVSGRFIEGVELASV
jgi:P4 family phage/plasmid primase-like protien